MWKAFCRAKTDDAVIKTDKSVSYSKYRRINAHVSFTTKCRLFHLAPMADRCSNLHFLLLASS